MEVTTQKERIDDNRPIHLKSSSSDRQSSQGLKRRSIRKESTSLNFQKVLHRIMSGEQTFDSQSSCDKGDAVRELNENFNAQIRMLQGEKGAQNQMNSSQIEQNNPLTRMADQTKVIEIKEQDNINQAENFQQASAIVLSGNGVEEKKPEINKKAKKNEDGMEITFEYLPKNAIPGFDPRNLHNVKRGKHQTIFINFKLKDFPEATLNKAINALQYGMKVKICIPSRKLNRKIFLSMSEHSSDKLKMIDLQKQTVKKIDITKIRDIEYGIKNEDHEDIRGIDSTRVINFLFNEKEEVECLVQFYTAEQRDLFMQGFQYFVKQSHKTTIASGSIFKLRNQIKAQLKLEEGKEGRIYDMPEILDILDSKVQLNISRAYMRELYVSVIKKTLDQKLAQQKLSYLQYSKIISGQSGLTIPLTTSQFLEIIDKLLDRSELHLMFDKATKSSTTKFLNFEAFKQFLLFSQKEKIDAATISEIFNKIVREEQRTNLQDQIDIQKELMLESPTNNTRKEPSKIEQAVEQASPHKPSNANEDSISFHGFVRYIYSKNNSIFNPKKLSLYQNMDRPINEYYINSAKSIYHANFDLLQMSKIAGFNFRHNDRNFPLLYALSRGARYIEIDVWDGENEPVITYGPTMNSKILISEFAEQLKLQAFIINSYPLFLNIVSYCSIKQSFKMRYILENIFSESLYKLPQDYKTRLGLPSPNALKNKIILIGKLPHDYDGIIQEHYTTQDVVKAQQAYAAAQLLASQASSHHKQPPSQPLPNRGFDNPVDSHHSLGIQDQQFQDFQNQSEQELHMNSLQLPNTSKKLKNNFNNLSEILLNPNNNNRSISFAAGGLIPIDGTLLTPVHAFSFHNLPGDSLDQEILELMLQDEEMEENTNVIVAGGYIDKNNNNNNNQNAKNIKQQTKSMITERVNEQSKTINDCQIDCITLPNSNMTSALASASALLLQENIQSTQRRGNTSSVRAIDSFFAKNLDRPRFKKYLQIKFDETASSSQVNNELHSLNGNSEVLKDGQDDIIQETNSSQMNKNQRGIFQNIQNHSGENSLAQSPKDNLLSTQGSANKLNSKQSQRVSDINGEYDEVVEIKVDKINQNNNDSEELSSRNPLGKLINNMNSNNNNSVIITPHQSESKRDSLKFNNSYNLQSPGQQLTQSQCTSIISSSAPPLSAPGLNSHQLNFQVSCIRDYAPVLASNSIESLFCMYMSKINNKKPALWEIYELSQRDMIQLSQNRLRQSAISSFMNLENFTKKFLAATKPKCKTADSQNQNPVPLFMQGIQFVETYLHTFDRYSLVYQSRFLENGGETCGYVLKPQSLRDVSNKSSTIRGKQQKNNDPKMNNDSQRQIPNDKDQNQETDSPNKNNLDFENEEDSETSSSHVKISIISGFNLSTVAVDRVDPYVEVIIVEGATYQSFKTQSVENNNMNPLWMYEVQFIVNQPSFTYLIFQVVNAIKGNLLGWFSLPFPCVRQGFRVIPLRDEFLNTLKNSFILCEVSIINQQITQQ